MVEMIYADDGVKCTYSTSALICPPQLYYYIGCTQINSKDKSVSNSQKERLKSFHLYCIKAILYTIYNNLILT